MADPFSFPLAGNFETTHWHLLVRPLLLPVLSSAQRAPNAPSVVLHHGQPPDDGHRIARELMSALEIHEDDLVEGSYADLLALRASAGKAVPASKFPSADQPNADRARDEADHQPRGEKVRRGYCCRCRMKMQRSAILMRHEQTLLDQNPGVSRTN